MRCERESRGAVGSSGFTLVELLVVISIIALLLSILMPALGKAREQARVMSDAANCKQISTYLSIYQTEYNGSVPVILNQYATSATDGIPIPAQSRFLSVALAPYSAETKNLGAPGDPILSKLDPTKEWSNTYINAYFQKYLPKAFVCPFVRGKAVDKTDMTPVSVASTLYGVSTPVVTLKGTRDTMSTWRYFNDRAGDIKYLRHPLGLPNGKIKYGALPFNRQYEQPLSPMTTADTLKNPIKWNRSDLQLVGAGSMSEATVAYCGQGQCDMYSQGAAAGTTFGVYNPNSHKKGNVGGTNAIFADVHVEWVPGTQIGWP
jgi:prepilin-type N-terminal cleavage/methylation domain-containing protein